MASLMNPRYSIGIDLGTTNCALAFVELEEGAESQVLAIRQRETERTEVERSSLPSFLYLTEEGNWEVGLYARERGREQPERLIHSAKSWLCHHSVSSQAKTLPWRSKRVDEGQKLSPIEASSRLLLRLKQAWDERFGKEVPFAEQLVTVTVPASFDAAAQAATREAAKLAGYPEGIRLLEEPQAAFYRWLEAVGEDAKNLRAGERILVVDIGGGTSDFSLFAVGDAEAGLPKIERVSVSEHLLLGGDNIDLALAHALESELAPDGGELSVDQWGHLLSRARALKELCLSEEGEDRQIAVSLPSKGSGLFAGTLSTEVSSEQARVLILEGFFPECDRDARAERSVEGLLEMGLPYAVDCAVTRHIAEFLGAEQRIDRALFNGGSLSPQIVQDRLLTQFAAWQGGRKPGVLANAETDLAVARGAAAYGANLYRGRRRIASGAARAVFLEVGAGTGSKRVCVLPKGAQPGERFEVEVPGLRLAVNQRARFQAFQGADSMTQGAGDWCVDDVGTMRSLPPLDACVEMDGRESLAVRLSAEVNELGLLTVSCESLEEGIEGSWPLYFNLRGDADRRGADPKEMDLGVSRGKLAGAERALRRGLFARGAGVKASRVFRELEQALGTPKHEWSLGICRAFSDTALESEEALTRSVEGTEAWLQLAGYALRPGFGAPGDADRLQRLQGVLQGLELSLPVRIEVPLLILLRRVAAGYEGDFQEELFERQLARWRETKRAEAERIRLLACLEQVSLSQKQKLYDELFARMEAQLAEEKSISSVLAGFANLLSRVSFGAGEDRILPPDTVEKLFDRLKKLDWKDPRYREAIEVFLAAARIVDDRGLNLSRRSSEKIVSKLEKSGVAAKRLLPLQDYVPITKGDRATLFGESLPPGLLLEGEPLD
ncbi:Hsp70 family protein [Pelagicoccus sp. SDUM812005]|uniref:hsp70 family protein n=1 Tax=Pelagicoccus sp. SDUM812005 TaxID=3041257 RepID=UPI00280FF158|nr:Hsp70 family protein [Pelagicoccus sp. SDUM812005]MDQ8183033.1 Hsp70 family protein [Pelagicoccus sp. SDUM812005]